MVTVKIVDQDGRAVPGATVSGSWSGLVTGSVSGVTGADGTVKFTSTQVKKPSGTFTFKVSDSTCTGYVYDPSRNAGSTVSVSF